jgi:Rps23 Pro-64 3,4-dihydroxylase Tpa1-like proline 4-hydroxylase
MKNSLDNFNINKVNAPYPIGYIDNFLNLEECKKLYDEINSFDQYDDLVMNGRKRVNKGSKIFKDCLNNSPNLQSLYEKLNDQNFYSAMKNKLDNIAPNNSWLPMLNEFTYSKENYGEQSFNFLKLIRKSYLVSLFFKKTLNLDIDFSKSKKGYFRQAHRDRDTRVISFLIYLNSIKEDFGGAFEVYESKLKDLSALKRFPEPKDVELVDKFSPKAGQLFLFSSTPDSYHGVSKFTSDIQERVFIYGSYSLDRKVIWEKNS